MREAVIPIFQYTCPKCKRDQELIQKHPDPAPLCCEESCGGIEMVNVIAASNFTFAGGGWAKDGYSKR